MADGEWKGSAGSPLPVAAWSAQNSAPGVTCPTFGIRALSALRLCVSAVLLLFAISAPAQYTIDWPTIDGGGTSTGGVYSVSGTIGQPDAGGPMTGGQYSLTGGFWSLIRVQPPGGPALALVPAGPGRATVSWTLDTPGFVLQETLSLSLTNWMNSPSGTNSPVMVPTADDTTFYRLSKS